ncbi:hypothetical protein LRC39_02080 [Rhodopseudomonas sp. P1]|uniref:hypothetical protein n=1 Tax=Rhodopseudomonas sp. P1 TaxID=3434357 RepID=UPI0031FD8953
METSKASIREQLERERVRLMDEAAQRIEAARALEVKMAKLAELEKLAADYGYRLTPTDGSSEPPTQETTAPPPKRERTATSNQYDGTFGGLIDRYRSDERSPYNQLKHNVRNNYDFTLNRLRSEIGAELVRDWSAARVQRQYDDSWAANGKLAMGHAVVGKLRLLMTFGSTILNDDACTRLSSILGNMRFPRSSSTPRVGLLTVEHVDSIRRQAHSWGLHSIALAQAFQFEVPGLRQMDVIGEWVPLSEPGPPPKSRKATKSGCAVSDGQTSMKT